MLDADTCDKQTQAPAHNKRLKETQAYHRCRCLKARAALIHKLAAAILIAAFNPTTADALLEKAASVIVLTSEIQNSDHSINRTQY
jgi:hypothetical protein